MAMTKTTEGFLPVTIRLPHTAVWKDEKALWRFMDLMFLCSFSDRKVRVGGKDVEVKRGEVIVSKLSLCKRWKVSRFVVDKFLATMQGERLVETEVASTRLTRVRVLSFCAAPANLYTNLSANQSTNVSADGQRVRRSRAANGSTNDSANYAATYTRNTNIRNYKKKENLYIREKELDLEDKFNNPDNFLW